MNSDSDNDSLRDGLEVQYGMDPTNPDTLDDGILDGGRIYKVIETSEDWDEGDAVKPVLDMQLRSMDADFTPKNDPDRLRHVVAKDLIDKLGQNDRVCVVNFATTAVLQIPFTSNKQAAKNAVDKFINGGTTALYIAVNVAHMDQRATL